VSSGRLPRLPYLLAVGLLLGACGGNAVREGDLAPQESPADLYVRLAAEYYNRGETETALRKIQQGLEEDDGNAQAHNVIATIYQRMDRDDLAERHFRIALDLAPSDPYILTAWGNFLCEHRRYAQAEQQFEKALANTLFNAPWLTLTRAGVCSRSAGDTRKAEVYFRRALSIRPTHGPALLQMAELDEAQGRHRSARHYLERYFKAVGFTPKSLLLAARVERKLGSRKRARGYEQMLRERFPDAPEVIYLTES
jgi:type IV pilus assembly protein PilF